jgi:hypothetical protein
MLRTYGIGGGDLAKGLEDGGGARHGKAIDILIVAEMDVCSVHYLSTSLMGVTM